MNTSVITTTKVDIMARRKAVGGDEVDAFSRARRNHSWRAGELKRIKAGANRRERRRVRRDVRPVSSAAAIERW